MPLPATTYDSATVLNPTATVTDFTLMVDLSRMSAAWWAAAEDTNRRRGRAAKDDETELPTDWVEYDHAGQTGMVRVKWTGGMTNKAVDVLRIYPPKAVNSVYNNGDTYGRDNAYDASWITYWPLRGTDTTDRTANGFDLTADITLSVGASTGKFGAATDFANAGAMSTAGTTAFDHSAAITVMAWAEANPATDIWTGIVGRALTDQIFLGQRGASDDIAFRGLDGVVEARATTSTIVQGTPKHFAGKADGSLLHVYENKVSQITAATTTVTTSGATTPFVVGDSVVTSANYWDGTIEEVQIHDTSRSAGWIAFEYDQSNDQAAFWGTWVNTPGPSVTRGGADMSSAIIKRFIKRR